MSNPFRYFNSSPEIIRLAVLMYVKYPLSLRNVEDLLAERGIDISHETVRFWWKFLKRIMKTYGRPQKLSPQCPGWSAGLSACFRAANQVKTNWRHCLRRPLTKSKRFPAWSTQRPRSCEFA